MQTSQLQSSATRTNQLCARNARSKQSISVIRSKLPMCISTNSRSAKDALLVTPNVFTGISRTSKTRRTPVVAVSASHHVYEGHLTAHPTARFGIVVGRFNDLVTKLLLEGALGTFTRHGVDADNIDVAWVPGSFELAVVARTMADTGKYDAIVCIGVVVRGATTHYDAVVSGATSGVLNASVTTGVPVIFGVLTCDTMEQALDRAGGKVGNKGGEAAATAVEMGNLMRKLKEDGKAK